MKIAKDVAREGQGASAGLVYTIGLVQSSGQVNVQQCDRRGVRRIVVHVNADGEGGRKHQTGDVKMPEEPIFVDPVERHAEEESPPIILLTARGLPVTCQLG